MKVVHRISIISPFDGYLRLYGLIHRTDDVTVLAEILQIFKTTRQATSQISQLYLNNLWNSLRRKMVQGFLSTQVDKILFKHSG